MAQMGSVEATSHHRLICLVASFETPDPRIKHAFHAPNPREFAWLLLKPCDYSNCQPVF